VKVNVDHNNIKFNQSNRPLKAIVAKALAAKRILMTMISQEVFRSTLICQDGSIIQNNFKPKYKNFTMLHGGTSK